MSTQNDAAANGTLVDKAEEFLQRYYDEEVGTLARLYPNDQKSLVVDWMDLYRFDDALADDFLRQPERVRQSLEQALANHSVPIDIDLSGANVRVSGLHDSDVYGVGETRSEHIGKFVGINGQVQKVTDVMPAPETVAYECQRCGTITEIPQSGGEIQEPHECEGCERQGPFQIDVKTAEFVDYQRVRVQQPPEETKGGQSSTIDIRLRGDVVNECDPGDRVTISGQYLVNEPDGDDETLSTYVDGDFVDVEDTDFEEIDIDDDTEKRIKAIANGEEGDPFDLLVKSIAPKHKGDDHIKRAMALQMFGGARVEYPDGSVDRGDSHILLLGDPGTGKTSLMRAVEKLAPRSTYASGKGASAAGMTAAAVRDDFGESEWALEAGALVLANKGIACVDEIDKVDEDAVSSLHGALESQVVNVNKAGINATLPARTALLAAGNPEYGRFTDEEPYAEQIDLGPTLLSRFDLMFMVSDQPDEEQDRDISRHMIESRRIAGQASRDPDSVSEEDLATIEPAIDPDVFRAYVAYAKQEVAPTIQDDEVAQKLADYMVDMRNANDDSGPVPVTFRKLEAIERLAEASARVRLSNTVNMADVERAIGLVEQSMRDVGVDPESETFDVDIIETGQSASQRERKQTIKQLLKEHADDGPARIEEIAGIAAEDHDITPGKARHEIREFKDKGFAYCPDSEQEKIVWLA